MLRHLDLERGRDYLAACTEDEVRGFIESLDWDLMAREKQRWPKGNWRTWVMSTGRRFGKTRTGAEYVHQVALAKPDTRIALIGRTVADVRDVMIKGRSGLQHTGSPYVTCKYIPSNREFHWPNGSMATTYSSEKPAQVRGAEFDLAWCDEIAYWRRLRETWEALEFAMSSLGGLVKVIATTTPRPLRFLRELYADPTTVLTSGATIENAANLSAEFLEHITGKYEGTTTGRQELEGELLDEAEGALWQRKHFDAHRVEKAEELEELVVAIDPAVTAHEESNETGIVTVGSKHVEDGGHGLRRHFYVLDDASGIHTPLAWAREALEAYTFYKADLIVAEVNNGGDLVEATIRQLDDEVPYRAVHAARGKQPRAQPVSSLYEQGRVHHVGLFEELEDQCCNWEPGTSTSSPDRLDALVWGITKLQGAAHGVPTTSLEGMSGLDRTPPWNP